MMQPTTNPAEAEHGCGSGLSQPHDHPEEGPNPGWQAGTDPGRPESRAKPVDGVNHGPNGIPRSAPTSAAWSGPPFESGPAGGSHQTPGFAPGAESTGYAGMFYAGPQAFAAGHHPSPAGFAQPAGPDPHAGSQGPGHQRHPKHDAHQYGQMMGLVNDLANGNADPSRVMAVLGNLDAQFWKGALVGVGVTLLLTNTAVRNALAGTLSGIFGAFSQKTEETPSQSK